jgi:hypothetical protein
MKSLVFALLGRISAAFKSRRAYSWQEEYAEIENKYLNLRKSIKRLK